MLERKFKVVIVGDFAVGKTSLLNAFTGTHDDTPASTPVPVSIEHDIVTSLGEKLRIQFWDTAGNEQYQQFNPYFTRNTDLAVVCFLPGKVQSAQKWIRNVKESSLNARFVGAVTQMDRIEGNPEAVKAAEQEARQLEADHELIAVYLTSSMKQSVYHEEIKKMIGVAMEKVSKKDTPTFTPKLVIQDEEEKQKQCC